MKKRKKGLFMKHRVQAGKVHYVLLHWPCVSGMSCCTGHSDHAPDSLVICFRLSTCGLMKFWNKRNQKTTDSQKKPSSYYYACLSP